MDTESFIKVGSTGTLMSLMGKEMEVLQAAAARKKLLLKGLKTGSRGGRSDRSPTVVDQELNNKRCVSGAVERDLKLPKLPSSGVNGSSFDRESEVNAAQALGRKNMEHPVTTTLHESVKESVGQNGDTRSETAAIVWKGSIYIPPKFSKAKLYEQRSQSALSRRKVSYGLALSSEIISALNEGTRREARNPGKTRKASEESEILTPMLRAELAEQELKNSSRHRKKSSSGRCLSFVDVVDLKCCYSQRALSSTFSNKLKRMNFRRLSDDEQQHKSA